MTTTTSITRKQVPNQQRSQHTADLFGLNFPLSLEPLVYALTDNIAEAYNGGYWEFYTLSNGGFYMAPHSDSPFNVSCENGFEGQLSGDALGITVCLYAYSHLSFSGKRGFDETCAQQYHWLRDYMLDHVEAAAILGAID
jgi:hypothetical protein